MFFKWSEAGAALWDAKWEMLIPVVAIVSLFYVPTTVEAAAVTATYALLVTTVIHRDLRPFKDLPRVATECGLLVGGVLLILGVALGRTTSSSICIGRWGRLFSLVVAPQ